MATRPGLEPLLGGPKLPMGCARCLWRVSKYGLAVVLSQPDVIRLLAYAGSALLVLFFDIGERAAAILMMLFTVGSTVLMCLLGMAVDRMVALQGPSTWDGVELANPEVRGAAVADFERANAGHEREFPDHLSVLEVYSLRNGQLEAAFREVQEEMVSREANVRRLYHGTSAFAVRQVIEDGFRLPRSAGMFGKGVYFADVPLKSWKYSTIGFMLVCDVALGREKRCGHADSSLTLSTLGEFDSAQGLARDQGGALRNPEWVVYRHRQAIPRLLLWVCKAEDKERVIRNLGRDARVARRVVSFVFALLLSFSSSLLFVIVLGVVLAWD